MAGNMEVMPWTCGCCGEPYEVGRRLVVCAECRQALCAGCRRHVQVGGKQVTYCPKCASRLASRQAAAAPTNG